jgi:hypothetical protein
VRGEADGMEQGVESAKDRDFSRPVNGPPDQDRSDSEA